MFHHELQRTARARNLADSLLTRTGEDQNDLLHLLLIENGGSLVTPGDTHRPGTHMVEIHLLDITGRGDTETAALSEWIKAARRASPIRATGSIDQGTAA
ncbi:MAG: hypothetical protein AAFY75_04110 [Pseudomonadota bacterium]